MWITGGRCLGDLLLGVEQLEGALGQAMPDCRMLAYAATCVSGWVNCREYWMNAWMSPIVIAPPTPARR